MNKTQAYSIRLSSDSSQKKNESIEYPPFFSLYIENILKFIMSSNRNDDDFISHQSESCLLPEQIFDIITSRDFNYQSKQKILFQKARITNIAEKYIYEKNPIKLYLALGGGYKAAIDTDNIENLNFHLGLGELLAVYQICRLEKKILSIYPHGIEFNIVLDNGVANYVNDIPTYQTEAYANLFRKVISKLKKEKTIKLVVQTEHYDWENESKKIKIENANEVTAEEYENIIRFLGKKCSQEEALERKAKYLAAMSFSGSLFRNLTDNGIWFLQFSSDNNLTFRPFPGGASRIQVGDIALKNENQEAKPFLISTRNISEYDLNILCENTDSFFEVFKID